MIGMQKKRSRMKSTLSYVDNNKMAKSEGGMDLGIGRFRLEMGWRFGILSLNLYTEFEFLLCRTFRRRVSNSFSVKLGRKSLCWRYCLLNPQQWMRSYGDLRKGNPEDRPWETS